MSGLTLNVHARQRSVWKKNVGLSLNVSRKLRLVSYLISWCFEPSQPYKAKVSMETNVGLTLNIPTKLRSAWKQM